MTHFLAFCRTIYFVISLVNSDYHIAPSTTSTSTHPPYPTPPPIKPTYPPYPSPPPIKPTFPPYPSPPPIKPTYPPYPSPPPIKPTFPPYPSPPVSPVRIYVVNVYNQITTLQDVQLTQHVKH
eukprot:122311_1